MNLTAPMFDAINGVTTDRQLVAFLAAALVLATLTIAYIAVALVRERTR